MSAAPRKVCDAATCVCGGPGECYCVESYPPDKCARCGAGLRLRGKSAPDALTLAWVEHFKGKPGSGEGPPAIPDAGPPGCVLCGVRDPAMRNGRCLGVRGSVHDWRDGRYFNPPPRS